MPDLERVSLPDIHLKIVFDLETSSRGSSAWDLLVQNTSNVVCSVSRLLGIWMRRQLTLQTTSNVEYLLIKKNTIALKIPQ